MKKGIVVCDLYSDYHTDFIQSGILGLVDKDELKAKATVGKDPKASVFNNPEDMVNPFNRMLLLP